MAYRLGQLAGALALLCSMGLGVGGIELTRIRR
jgi:hypothetical protein